MSGWWERRLAHAGDPALVQQQRVVPNRLPELVTTRNPPNPADLCPGCGSEDYFAATKLTAKRCYDCGYPIVQSGTGVSSGRTDGTTKKSTQVKTGGYSPGTIIGKVQ